MTSVADLYYKEIAGDIATPPDALIELFNEWISEDQSLCCEAQPPLELPFGSIPMVLIPPIEGIIRWCSLSPLYLSENDVSYSKLHLSLLQSLMQATQNGSTPNTVNALSLSTIIESIKNESERLRLKGIDPKTHSGMQTCLERFAQAIQLGIVSRVITGSIPQLLCRIENLPQNPLMSLVITKQKENYL